MGGTSVDGANITLTTEELATNCRYGVTISAFNAGGLATSHATISMLAFLQLFYAQFLICCVQVHTTLKV